MNESYNPTILQDYIMYLGETTDIGENREHSELVPRESAIELWRECNDGMNAVRNNSVQIEVECGFYEITFTKHGNMVGIHTRDFTPDESTTY